MSATVEIEVTFQTCTCYRTDCGITWAMPDWYVRKLRENHSSFFCPRGHSQAFLEKSETEKLREQLQREKENVQIAEAAKRRIAADRDSIDRSRRAFKGVATKRRGQLEKVAAGVCPCCDATFDDLRQHIADAHPHFAGEPANEDELAGIVQSDDKTS